MSPEAIITGIVTILVAVLGGGFWQYRQSRKEAPVKKKDADLAAAKTAQQMALDIADDLREDVARFREELNTEREERNKLSGRVDSLETHIREQDKTIRRLRDAIRIFTAAWDDLTHRWDFYRKSDHPPARPNINID